MIEASAPPVHVRAPAPGMGGGATSEMIILAHILTDLTGHHADTPAATARFTHGKQHPIVRCGPVRWRLGGPGRSTDQRVPFRTAVWSC